MIQREVAGLQIINGGGSPGEGATIRIRSGSSLSANNDPLYVIDNVPVAAGGINGEEIHCLRSIKIILNLSPY
jgi:iron complex outermembrane receptor protein